MDSFARARKGLLVHNATSSKLLNNSDSNPTEGTERRSHGLASLTAPIERYRFMRDLQDTNETLFYSLITHNVEETLPIVYQLRLRRTRRWSRPISWLQLERLCGGGGFPPSLDSASLQRTCGPLRQLVLCWLDISDPNVTNLRDPSLA